MPLDIEKSFSTLSPNWARLPDIFSRLVLTETSVTNVISYR